MTLSSQGLEQQLAQGEQQEWVDVSGQVLLQQAKAHIKMRMELGEYLKERCRRPSRIIRD